MTSTEKGWNIKQAELEDLGNSGNRNEMKFKSTKWKVMELRANTNLFWVLAAQLEIDEKENLCTFIDVQSYSKLQRYCYSEERQDTVGMQKMKDFCFY